MKHRLLFIMALLITGLLIGACAFLPTFGDSGLESTQIALAIQQTGMAIQQANAEDAAAPAEAVQPTYTPYPTHTPEGMQAPPAEVQPQMPVEESAPAASFDEWKKDAKILLYDAMTGRGDTPVIQNAIDGLGLGRNTTIVGDAVGDFISSMNSATQWDLIIVGSEYRSSVQGEIFDVIFDQIDRGSSFVLETWYLDQVHFGRVQPIMQRCGISFHRDWWREDDLNLNEYLVYLLEPDHTLFSQPNAISMLIPYDTRWVDDVGDTVSINPGSGATLLAGTQSKVHDSYGLITECLDGRMIWQTFSTHDYKDQDMINLWQNYIYNTLEARYDYLQQ